MSLLSDAASFGLDSAASVAGQAVTYRRGSTTVLIYGAIQGSTNLEATSVFPGARVADRSVDWIIEAAQLIGDDGVQLVPERGDTITTNDGTKYHVIPSSENDDFWKWVDRESKTRRRIFTKERN